MSKRKTDISTSSRPQYTRSYGALRGVDFSSDPSEVTANRAADLVNMYRDYDSEHGAAIETIPGYRCLFDFGGKIHGIWGYSSSQDENMENYVVVHAGTCLFTFKADERDSGQYEKRFDGLADSSSTAFLQNNNFYICDGTGIYVMKSDFTVCSLEDDAYIPITYISGEPYEQRNMICDRFINRDTVVVSGLFEELVNTEIFTVYTDWERYISDNFEYKITGGNLYNGVVEVTDIKTRARKTNELDAREILGRYSDQGSETKDNYCYVKLSAELIDALGLNKDDTLFTEPTRLIGKGLNYGSMWNEISDEIKALVDEYYTGEEGCQLYGKYTADITIFEPCKEITKVTVNGEEIPQGAPDIDEVPPIFYLPVQEIVDFDGKEEVFYSFIHLYSANKIDIDTLEIEIHGVAAPLNFQKSGEQDKHISYIKSNKEYTGTAKDAILKCGIATTFDGRVFLTGNPKLPNTVFYSQRDLTGYNNPTYWGAYNYFNDGVDNAPNVALLATSSVLMVMKQSTIHGSSIYYHTGADGVDDVVPRIYPSVPGVAGLGCEGAALNFLDDAIFISERGIEGVSKEALNLERTIGHRSSNIDRFLRERSLSKAKMCRWGGYLCVFDGDGKIYLGDSRQLFQGVDGAIEYEWFLLDGIGAYQGGNERYRTLTVYPEISNGYTLADATYAGKGLSIAEESEYVDYSEVKSVEVEYPNGKLNAWVIERDGADIICDTDGELEGGEFSPACIGFSISGVLYFGTERGQVCCFNTDKRGQAFGGEEVDTDAIHNEYYTFCGRRYSAWIALKSDNCGVPHLTKRTSRKTCVMKLKAMFGSMVNVKVRTDREDWEDVVTSQTNTMFSFEEMNFGNFTFSSNRETIVTLKEKKKKWVEKQFLFKSDGFKAPFGLYNITFNYEIQGRVKK